MRDGAFDFITPAEWLDYGVLDRYEGLVLDRKPKNKKKIIGAGHKVFDKAVADALKIKATVAASKSIENHLLFFSVYNQVTDSAKEKGARYYACEVSAEGAVVRTLSDWEALKILNSVSIESDVSLPSNRLAEGVEERCVEALKAKMSVDEFAPQLPIIALDAALLAAEVA